MRLRALALADCETLLSWIPSADALFQWSGPWDFRWPLDRLQLQRDLSRAGDHRRRYVAVSASDELVGHAMLTIQPEHGLGVIGRVLIDPARRGEGLGNALMHEIVRVGFDELGLHRLQLGVYDFNLGAIACYERAGFVIEGRLRDSTRGSTGYWSGYLMALLEPEYRAHGEPEPGGVVRRARFVDAPGASRLVRAGGRAGGRSRSPAGRAGPAAAHGGRVMGRRAGMPRHRDQPVRGTAGTRTRFTGPSASSTNVTARPGSGGRWRSRVRIDQPAEDPGQRERSEHERTGRWAQ